MNRYLILGLAAAAVVMSLLSACRGKEGGENIPEIYRITNQAELDSIQNVLIHDPENTEAGLSLLLYLISGGWFDEAIELSNKISTAAAKSNDRMTIHIARTYTALTYTMKNELDSIKPYLNSVKYIYTNDSSTYYSILANSTAAIYAMKKELNYSKALKHFKKALNVATKNEDLFNQGAILSNISSIYLIRKDTTGAHYAREAFRTAKKAKSPYIIIRCAITLANMMFLEGRYNEAISYADTAAYYEESWKIMTFRSDILLTKAAAKIALGNLGSAAQDLEQTKEILSESTPEMQTRYYIEYGKYLLASGNTRQAADMFEKALSAPGCTHENRQKLYLLLSEAWSALGDASAALNCYKLYHKSSDSLSISQKERDFNTLLMQYEQTKYEKEISDKELTIERNGRRATVIISILAVISVAAVCILLTYRKKTLMYRSLVGQHQQYMEQKKQMREEIAQASRPQQDDSKDRELFARIETLMNTEKAYCMKDISLERISEMLSSNRSYVSKVINGYAGQSFSSYINSKRIEEATRILSDPEDDTPLKALSEALGYGTLSTFYRAFQKETGCPPSRYREEVRRMKSEDA